MVEWAFDFLLGKCGFSFPSREDFSVSSTDDCGCHGADATLTSAMSQGSTGCLADRTWNFLVSVHAAISFLRVSNRVHRPRILSCGREKSRHLLFGVVCEQM